MKTLSLLAGSCPPLLTAPLPAGDAESLARALKVLLGAGLVEREQRGSWAYFRVVPEPLAALRELLA